jgi:hypothetical protein
LKLKQKGLALPTATMAAASDGTQLPLQNNTSQQEDMSVDQQSPSHIHERSAPNIPPINNYRDYHQGPYFVHISSTNSVGRQHPLKLGKLLFTNNIQGIEDFQPIGRNLVKVTFRTGKDANEFLKNPLLTKHNWQGYIPNYQVTRKGVIRDVEPNMPEEEILTHLKSTLPVVHVRRIYKTIRLGENARNANGIPQAKHTSTNSELNSATDKTNPQNNLTKVPTSTVVVTFDGNILPQSCKLYFYHLPVHTYIPQVKQCTNCQHYGHFRKQ